MNLFNRKEIADHGSYTAIIIQNEICGGSKTDSIHLIGKQQLYRYAVYALAGIVLVFLIIIGALIRRLRQAVRTGKNIVTDHDIPVSPAERQESESGHYMELRPPQMQSPEPTYESLQSRYSTHYYSNVGFVGEKSGNDDVRVYENVESGGIV